MENDGDEQNDEFTAYRHTERHANEDTVEQDSHFQEKTLHHSLLVYLLWRHYTNGLVPFGVFLDSAFVVQFEFRFELIVSGT